MLVDSDEARIAFNKENIIGRPITVDDDDILLQNTLDGKLAQELLKSSNAEYVVPILLFFDEFCEVCPIGPFVENNKMSVFQWRAVSRELDTDCFFLAFAKSAEVNVGRKIELLNTVIMELVADIGGTPFTLPNGSTCEIIVIAFVADNLAQHQVGGYLESFNATLPCSRCLLPKPLFHTSFNEKVLGVRRRTCMLTRMQISAIKKAPPLKKTSFKKKTGLVGVLPAVMNLPRVGVHFPDFFPCEIMHDVLQDKYHFIFKSSLFYLPFLSLRVVPYCIQSTMVYLKSIWAEFNHSKLNDGILKFRKQSDRLENHEALPSANFTLNFTSNQSATQYRILLSRMGLILKNINVPSVFFQSPNWKCFELLHRITSSLFSPFLLVSDVSYIEQCIEKFLSLYSSLYQNSFPNKFHHLIHIPSSLLTNGPLRFVAAMPFERRLSDIHLSIKSRKSIITQIANCFKHQMTHFVNNLKMNSKTSFDLSSKGIQLHTARNDKRYSDTLTTNVVSHLPANCKIHLSLRHFGCFLAKGLAISCNTPEKNWLSNSHPIVLWEITVVFNHEKQIFMLLSNLKVIRYCPEMLAYEVTNGDRSYNKIISSSSLQSKTFSIHQVGSSKYVFVDSLPIKKF